MGLFSFLKSKVSSHSIVSNVKCPHCNKVWRQETIIEDGTENQVSEMCYPCGNCSEFVTFDINGIPVNTTTRYWGI